MDAVGAIEDVSALASDPGVAVKGELDYEALALVDEVHLFHNALNSAFLDDLTLSNRLTKLAADLDALEVFSKVVTSE